MIDLQSERPEVPRPINRVGVKGVRSPITVLDRANSRQCTVATINMYVTLPTAFRGTHMSRFLEILHRHKGEITRPVIRTIVEEMRTGLDAQAAMIDLRFPYFIEKRAPVSRLPSLMDYDCRLLGVITQEKGFEEILEVQVPVTNLCPCSKEISRYGAHNQRGKVKVTLSSRKLIWIEEVVQLVEESASAPVYALLKRDDERLLTEQAYDNPRFVEDVVRLLSQKLDRIEGIDWYTVSAENLESIHNHSAYALLRHNVSGRFEDEE